jgi:hypothetical protein
MSKNKYKGVMQINQNAIHNYNTQIKRNEMLISKGDDVYRKLEM